MNTFVQMVEKHMRFGHAYCDEVGVRLYRHTFTCHHITDKKTFYSIYHHQRGRGTCICGRRVRNSKDNPDAEVGSHCSAYRVQHMEDGHSCRTSQLLSHLVGPVWTTSVFI